MKKLLIELKIAETVCEDFDLYFKEDEEFRNEILDAIETNILNGYYKIEEESK
jgi:hypothetical protein